MTVESEDNNLPLFSHLSEDGQPRMVDITGKLVTPRMARARAVVHLGERTARSLRETGQVGKGPVQETAIVAGIMAAKATPQLIPMCHPIPVGAINIDMELQGSDLVIDARVSCCWTTGVEMEAMAAASVAALTVYDMCKSADKGITIGSVYLLEKAGGKSGHWRRHGAD